MAMLSTNPRVPRATHDERHDAADALERLALATERAAAARIERALHTATEAGRDMVRSAVLLAAAIATAAFGWITLMVGVVLFLAPLLGAGFAAGAVGLPHAIVGAGIATAVSLRARGDATDRAKGGELP